MPPPPPVEVNGVNENQVSSIDDSRVYGNQFQYLTSLESCCVMISGYKLQVSLFYFAISHYHYKCYLPRTRGIASCRRPHISVLTLASPNLSDYGFLKSIFPLQLLPGPLCEAYLSCSVAYNIISKSDGTEE